MNKEIEKLIVKFFINQANTEELKKLSYWLSKSENEGLFSNYVKLNYAIDINMNEFNTKEAKKKLLDQIKQDKNIFYRFKLNRILKYAAIATLIFGLGYFYQQDSFLEKLDGAISIPKDESVITLKLENGNTKVISENGKTEIFNSEGNIVGKQQGSQLIYNKDISIKKLIYNTLSVPYGKRFCLVLSDGTTVKLNAGTSIKYPVQFIKGFDRKVFLNGEAYFDVEKDQEHPFIVNANQLNVKVLGTEFNMSFYPEDADINTVLIEGSVQLYEENKTDLKQSTILTPGHKASWNISNKEIAINKVDTNLYTAWKDGVLLFKSTSFKNIREKLKRHFNITILNEYKTLDNQIYSASFDKEVNIEDILEAFRENIPFEYNILEGNRIIITKPNN